MVCWWKVQYEVKDYVEMPGKIVFQLRGSSELMNEDRTYDNEYVWIFHLTDGPEPKIKHGKEFFDSLYAHQFFASISGAQEGWSHAMEETLCNGRVLQPSRNGRVALCCRSCSHLSFSCAASSLRRMQRWFDSKIKKKPSFRRAANPFKLKHPRHPPKTWRHHHPIEHKSSSKVHLSLLIKWVGVQKTV